LIKYSLLVVA